MLASPLLRSRSFHALLLFALAFSGAGTSIAKNRQLEHLGELTDEWYYLGANLNVTGTLGYGDAPVVLRPPGYPFFVAAALRAFAGTPAVLTQGYMDRGASALYLAQSLVLGISAAMLYVWLSGFVDRGVAFAAAFTFGLNPYCVVLAGLFHYDLLHMAATIAGCYTLGRALAGPDPPAKNGMLLAGVVWGLATLVRSLTMVLPAFVLLALLVRTRFTIRPALKGALWFALGLVLTVAPWTVRNYAVSGRFVPVNLQGWAAVWGSTVKVLGVHPNHYNWYQLGDDLMPIFSRVTGETQYSYPAYLKFNAELEQAFKRETLHNLREMPEVYVQNVLYGFYAMNVHINSVVVKAFQHIQEPGAQIEKRWFEVGNPQAFHSSAISDAFAAQMYVMSALAFGGGILAVRRGETALLAAGAAYLCVSLVHSLFYMDLLYFYLKVPFVFVFSAFFVSEGRDWLRQRPSSWSQWVDVTLLALLPGFSLALTLAIL